MPHSCNWQISEVVLTRKHECAIMKMMSWFVCTGWKVTEEQLEEVAQLSDVLACDDDFLSPDFRAKCEQIIPDPLALDVNDCAHAFRYLRDNIQLWYCPNIIFNVITQRWLHFMNSVSTKNLLKLYEHNKRKHKPASIDNLSRGLTILKAKTCIYIYTTINHNIWQE